MSDSNVIKLDDAPKLKSAIEIGVELNYYPIENDLEFKKDEVVLFEKSHRILAESKIVDVVYEEYEMEIKRGRKLDKWWVERFKDIEIDDNTLYAIKKWKPFYVLDNGIKIEWSHQLYHKSIGAKEHTDVDFLA